MVSYTSNHYATALTYAYFIHAAYQVAEIHEDLYINPLQDEYPYFPEDYTLVYSIHMAGDPIPEYYGFLARSSFSPTAPPTYVLALKGSSDFLEWTNNLDILPSPGPFGNNSGNIVSGFLDIFNSMTFSVPGINKPKGLLKDVRYSIGSSLLHEDEVQPFVCTGHSLGATMATLFAAGDAYSLFPCRVYTFASPCVGDAAFVSFYNNLITTSERYYNLPDIVPTILDAFGYDHVHTGIPLDSLTIPNISWIPDCTHSLGTYMHLLGAQSSILNGNCLLTFTDDDMIIKKLSFRKRY